MFIRTTECKKTERHFGKDVHTELECERMKKYMRHGQQGLKIYISYLKSCLRRNVDQNDEKQKIGVTDW